MKKQYLDLKRRCVRLDLPHFGIVSCKILNRKNICSKKLFLFVGKTCQCRSKSVAPRETDAMISNCMDEFPIMSYSRSTDIKILFKEMIPQILIPNNPLISSFEAKVYHFKILFIIIKWWKESLYCKQNFILNIKSFISKPTSLKLWQYSSGFYGFPPEIGNNSSFVLKR